MTRFLYAGYIVICSVIGAIFSYHLFDKNTDYVIIYLLMYIVFIFTFFNFDEDKK